MPYSSPLFTIPCELRDYPEWHYGRQMYCVWTLPVRDRLVLERLQAAQQHLSPWLHQDYRRQAHITLFVCGFDALVQHRDDDFTRQAQQLQCEALEMLAQASFSLQIGGLDSFASAPYLQVSDPEGVLAVLRERLETISSEVRQAEYVPHLTVGLFQQALSWSQLQARISSFNRAESLTLRVSELELSCYRASELFGPLARIASVPLL
ncbi:2'-5' RNA ligase family protein [Marinobacterium iners]|uniref:2'-5' RNA ligase n=1 Tax=Marinobacterium iners DSM 11526 TaxID=1122198 RepID=A0A1H4GNJ4_9GAMM|nr:2'-5' RNA ligase family protein [Marinobacterium iners]SEB11154.1 2'-5' RNA ligase [Marinobacterium iners DSM 11526]